MTRRMLGRRGWLPWVVLAAVVGGGTVLLAGPVQRTAARSMSFEHAAAWLSSTTAGQSDLVDGASAQVVTRVSLAGAQAAAVQSGADEYVASADGTVRRISGATYDVSPPAALGAAGRTLALYPSAQTLFVVDQGGGTVTAADSRTLQARSRYTLDAEIPTAGAVADGAGGLWVLDAGTLKHLGAAGTTIAPGAVSPTRTHLVSAAGRPVVVDLGAGRAWLLGAGGRVGSGACVDTGAGDSTTAVVGAAASERIYATSGRRGELLISDLASGRCGGHVDLRAAGHRLGQPLEAGGHVFVPDLTAGRVLVVDVTTGRLAVTPQLVAAGTTVELLAQGGTVFFNSPRTATAGVVAPNGTVRPVEKYDPAKLDILGPGGGDGVRKGDGSDKASGASAVSQPAANTKRTDPQAAVPGTITLATNSPATSAPPVGQPQVTASPQQQQDAQSPTRTGPASVPQPGVRIAVSAPQARVGRTLTLQAVVVGAAGSASTGTISGAVWSFGDGDSATGVQVSHAWASAGTYLVSATVRLADGTAANPATSITVTKQEPPKARLDVTPPKGEAPLVVTADASLSSRGDAPIATYSFDFGDGTGATAATSTPTASHRYTQDGFYLVTVTVTDSAGHASAASKRVTVGGGLDPSLAVSPRTGKAPLAVTVTAPTSTGTRPFSYVFDLGDGTTTASDTPSLDHIYTTAGTYTVTVTVTDANGKRGTASTTVTVDQRPDPPKAVLWLSQTGGQAILQVAADAGKSSGGTGALTYQFDFADGHGQTTQTSPTTATHLYGEDGAGGTYQVTLTVTDATGATATATDTVTVTAAHLRIAANASTIERGQSVTFTATGANAVPDAGADFDFTIVNGPAGSGESHQHLSTPSWTYVPPEPGTWTFAVSIGSGITSNTVTVEVTDPTPTPTTTSSTPAPPTTTPPTTPPSTSEPPVTQPVTNPPPVTEPVTTPPPTTQVPTTQPPTTSAPAPSPARSTAVASVTPQ